MGHFSAIAGAVALAMIVIPVVVHTTEDMLLLVPNTLREASAALGLPRWLVIRHVAYRAAQAGIITGVLLAIARITGETAPLLFTALDNQFFSWNLNAPMASLPVIIFQFALHSPSGLAAAGLDRGSPHHRYGAGLEHLGARAFFHKGLDIILAIHTNLKEAVAIPSQTAAPLEERVTVRRLNFYYGAHRALADINVNLYRNKVTAFIGPSGCGKSTLLRVLNRMYDLYPNQRAEGEVILDGEKNMRPSQDVNLLRAKVGMVFQKPTPFPLTIYENIAFGVVSTMHRPNPSWMRGSRTRSGARLCGRRSRISLMPVA